MTPALLSEITPALPVFAALLLGHALGDFVLQTRWMVRRKRNAFVLLLHVALVGAATTLCLGGVWQVAVPVMLAHLLIDMVKVYALPARTRDTLAAFLGDQAAHLATLIAAAMLWSGALEAGWFAGWQADLKPVMLIAAGLILSVLAGGHAVGLVSSRFTRDVPQDGLRDAGRVIGQLERVLIFLLILVGQPAGIGFLIAAKSILRFDTAAHQRAGEYVIIGTLASFTWALAVGYATLGLLEIASGNP